MKLKVFILSLITAAILSFVIFMSTAGVGNASVEKMEVEMISEDLFVDKIDPIYATPEKLIIPSVNIDTTLVELGVEKDGTLEAPVEWGIAGWYRKSSKSGEEGNVVIVGHYNTNTGAPAIFWSLKNLRAGDTVYLSDAFDRIYSYQVSEVFYVDITDSDRLSVLEECEDSSLVTLITCGGIWLPGDSTYSKRLVVKATLIS